jgi:hypothetical protein
MLVAADVEADSEEFCEFLLPPDVGGYFEGRVRGGGPPESPRIRFASLTG